jgi:hypothetical protein
LALRPERLAIAFFAIVGLVLAAKVPSLWLAADDPLLILPGAMGDALGRALASVLSGNLSHAGAALAGAFWFLPKAAIVASPLSAAVLILPSVAIWVVSGLALARMTACDAAQGVVLRWPLAVAFAMKNARSAAGALLTPVVGAVVLIAVLAAGGWLLLEFVPGRPIGGLLYILAILASFALVLAAAVLGLGQPLILPSVACDKADAIDALQRAAAYVLNRPLRLLVYYAIAGSLLVLTTVLAFAMAGAVAWVARESTHALLSEESLRALATASVAAAGSDSAEPSAWHADVARWFIEFWSLVPRIMAGAVALSCLHACCTLVYLCVRRLNDGQDVAEIWMPTMIPGTVAELRARGEDDEE